MDSLRLLTRGSGRKAPKSSTTHQQDRPSASTNLNGGKEPSPLSKKRTRADFEADLNGRSRLLPEDEIRQIQKLHKIKITDLRARHNDENSEGRKSQKEASRLYPQPLQNFSDLTRAGVNHALVSNLVEQGYKEPTEVQLATIPMLISEDSSEPDLLTIAPTGSGKTLAFLIPLINKTTKKHQDHNEEEVSVRQVSAIILAPTKELVTQIVNEGRKLAARTGVHITAFKKGMRLHEDIRDATQDDLDASEDSGSDAGMSANLVKSDILVSTPLSLLHAITPANPENPVALPNIHTLILDEADILLDSLFRTQTLSIYSSFTSPQLRTSLWSATIGSNIEELAISTITTRQKTLHIKSKHHPPLLRCIIGLKDSSLPNISHKLIYASTEAGKLTGLRNLIRPPPSAVSNTTGPLLRPPFLIFTQTIDRAQALHDELKYDVPPSTNADIPRITVLHSSLSSTTRSKIMQNFRLGKIWILITTDLLSRGIDFRGVNGVVNYDIPTTSASYVHRAGRTGRAGRSGGVCVTLYTRDDVLYLRPIVNVIHKSQKVHDEANETNDTGVREENQIPSWLMDSLPSLSKNVKKELKQRGVDVRRGVKESDDKKERRRKGRNLIGTRSGYEKKLEDRRKGMIEGSRRRKQKEETGTDSDGGSAGGENEFGGFD